MNVCRFYQQGFCRYGDSCRYDHPNPTRQSSGGYRQQSGVSPLMAYGPGSTGQPLSPRNSSAVVRVGGNQQLPSFTFNTPGVRSPSAVSPMHNYQQQQQKAHWTTGAQPQAKLPQFTFSSTAGVHKSPFASVRDETPMEQESLPYHLSRVAQSKPVANVVPPQQVAPSLPSFTFKVDIREKTKQPQLPPPAVVHSSPLGPPVASTSQEVAADQPYLLLTSKDPTYSRLEELGKKDQDVYCSKSRFVYGQIPGRPPPIELCH